MKYFKALFLTFMMTALVACAALGVPQATTFNQKLEVGYTSIEAVADSATTLLKAGKLSKADAQNVLEQATNAKVAIDLARSVHDTNPTLGDSKLSSALTVLQALQVYVGGVK